MDIIKKILMTIFNLLILMILMAAIIIFIVPAIILIGIMYVMEKIIAFLLTYIRILSLKLRIPFRIKFSMRLIK